jgi:hypothetical protein
MSKMISAVNVGAHTLNFSGGIYAANSKGRQNGVLSSEDGQVPVTSPAYTLSGRLSGLDSVKGQSGVRSQLLPPTRLQDGNNGNNKDNTSATSSVSVPAHSTQSDETRKTSIMFLK